MRKKKKPKIVSASIGTSRNVEEAAKKEMTAEELIAKMHSLIEEIEEWKRTNQPKL